MIVVSIGYNWTGRMIFARRFKDGRNGSPLLSEFVRPFNSPSMLADLVEWLNQQQPEVIAGDAWLAARYPEIVDELTRKAFERKP